MRINYAVSPCFIFGTFSTILSTLRALSRNSLNYSCWPKPAVFFIGSLMNHFQELTFEFSIYIPLSLPYITLLSICSPIAPLLSYWAIFSEAKLSPDSEIFVDWWCSDRWRHWSCEEERFGVSKAVYWAYFWELQWFLDDHFQYNFPYFPNQACPGRRGWVWRPWPQPISSCWRVWGDCWSFPCTSNGIIEYK